VLAKAVVVQDTLPEGSNWDGKSGLLVDEKTYSEMITGKSEAPRPAPAAGTAPSAGNR
jgi:hypothetical protein